MLAHLKSTHCALETQFPRVLHVILANKDGFQCSLALFLTLEPASLLLGFSWETNHIDVNRFPPRFNKWRELLAKFHRKNKHEDDVADVSILWCGPRPSRGRCLSAAALPASSPLGP